MQKISVNFKTFIFLLFLTVALILLDNNGYLKKPKSFFISFILPVQKELSSGSNFFADIVFSLQEIDRFKENNKNLEIENQKLNIEIANLKEVERENEILREQINFKDNLCEDDSDCISVIKGNKIGGSLEDYSKYITIDIGSDKGAKEGGAVTIAGGIMIGKISEVFSDYSKVILIISPESSINSLAQTTRANGLVKGKYGTGIKLEMIDQSEELIKNDLVITSSLEGEIPKGLILGRIATIKESPNEVFKSADIDLLCDFNKIEEVFLIIENEQ